MNKKDFKISKKIVKNIIFNNLEKIYDLFGDSISCNLTDKEIKERIGELIK